MDLPPNFEGNRLEVRAWKVEPGAEVPDWLLPHVVSVRVVGDGGFNCLALYWFKPGAWVLLHDDGTLETCTAEGGDYRLMYVPGENREAA